MNFTSWLRAPAVGVLLTLAAASQVFAEGTFDIPAGSSDGESFQNRGVPVSGFTTGLDDCYHAACDRAETLDRKAFDDFTDAIAGTIARFATSPQVPAR